MVDERDTGPRLEESFRGRPWAVLEPEARRKAYGRNAAAYLIDLLRERRSLRENIVVIDAGADKKAGPDENGQPGLNMLFQSAVDALLSPPRVKFLAINLGEEVTGKYQRNFEEQQFTRPSPLHRIPLIGRFVDATPRRQLIRDTHAIAADFSDRTGFTTALRGEGVKDVDLIILYHNAYRWLFTMAERTRYYKRLTARKGITARRDVLVAERAIRNMFDFLMPGGLLVFDDPRAPEGRPNAVELVAEMRELKMLDFDVAWMLARGDYPVLIVHKPPK